MFFRKMQQLWCKQICLSRVFSSFSILEQGFLVVLVLPGLLFFCQLVTSGISPTCCIYWWFSSWILVELFFFGCSVYSLSGIQLQLFPVSKEWNALVLIVRISHHSFPGITSDRPTLTFYDQNFPSFSKQCFAGEIKAKHGASLPLKICICEKFTQIFSGHFTRKKQQSQQ